MLIYTLKTCDSCRKAVKWLRENGIAHSEKPIRETPPTPEELLLALSTAGGEIRKLFNTSGQDYRALGISRKLPTLSTEEAVALLAANGNLVRRPFLVTETGAHAGFHPDTWEKIISG